MDSRAGPKTEPGRGLEVNASIRVHCPAMLRQSVTFNAAVAAIALLGCATCLQVLLLLGWETGAKLRQHRYLTRS